MDDYDDDDDVGMFGDDTVYQAEDNYITLPEEAEEDDEEEEDTKIKDTDAILLATRTEDDFSSLEVYVYDEESGNMYVHHDIALSAFLVFVLGWRKPHQCHHDHRRYKTVRKWELLRHWYI